MLPEAALAQLLPCIKHGLGSQCEGTVSSVTAEEGRLELVGPNSMAQHDQLVESFAVGEVTICPLVPPHQPYIEVSSQRMFYRWSRTVNKRTVGSNSGGRSKPPTLLLTYDTR